MPTYNQQIVNWLQDMHPEWLSESEQLVNSIDTQAQKTFLHILVGIIQSKRETEEEDYKHFILS